MKTYIRPSQMPPIPNTFSLKGSTRAAFKMLTSRNFPWNFVKPSCSANWKGSATKKSAILPECPLAR